MTYSQIIKLLRPHQYIKNLFVFAPIVFSFQINGQIIIESFIVFVLFSLIASSIYVINDYMDIEEDKCHPYKKHRPLASGKVSLKSARILILILSSISLIASYFYSLELLLVLTIYLLLNIAYSFKLKHIAIIDIFIISTGFVLRLFAGATVLDTHISMWMIVMTFLLALFLAIAKRRDDILLSKQGKETRKNIDGYNLEFVNTVMVLMAGVIIVSYILYTVSSEIILRLNTQHLYLTSIFVILGIIRYMQITFVEENSGSPTRIVLKDRFLHVTIFFWILSFFIVVKI